MTNHMKVPSIRFKGFTDDWEQRKLSDILERRQIYQQISKDTPRLAFAAGQGVIPLSERKTNNRDQLIADEATKRYLLTEYNDLVYNPANLKYGAIDRNKFGRGLISPIYVTFTTTEEPSFIERIITSDNFKLKALQFEEGTVVKRQSVSPDNLLSFAEWISPHRKEQSQIGELFTILDNHIALYQQKHDNLLVIRSIMLEKMFPKEGQKIPEIRFKGFTGDWEKRKLSELFSYTSSSLTIKDVEPDGKYDLYDANNLIGKTNSKPMNTDYITIIKDGAGVGRTRKLPANSMFIGTMGGLQTSESDIDFIISLLRKVDFSSQFSGSTIPHIYFKDYGEVTYLIPNIDEQITIGKYFGNLDNFITLQHRKIEKLKNIKKAMLGKMFV